MGIQLTGDSKGSIDEAHVAIRLREIAPLATGGGMYILAKQAQMITIFEQIIEYLDCLVHAPDYCQGFNVPESTNQKGSFGFAKIIRMLIAEKEPFFGFQMFFQNPQVLQCPLALGIELTHSDQQE